MLKSYIYLKATNELPFPKAKHIELEFLESSSHPVKGESEFEQILQCWTREHLGESLCGDSNLPKV
jgi:hypothetical protein